MHLLLSIRRYLRHPTRLIVGAITLLIIYLIFFGAEICAALNYPEILIAPIMALGSFVAGATFLGGGAVAFPALTKLLGADPQTAKSFSFAIQSVGMTSASLYILTRIPVLPVTFILTYVIAATIGLSFSLTYFQNLMPSTDIRIGFTTFVLCFLIVYLWTARKTTVFNQVLKNEITLYPGGLKHQNIYLDIKTVSTISSCAFLGGVVTGLIGSGADLFAFCLLTLFFRIDIKLSTQISVIIMATISIMGVGMELVIYKKIPMEVKQLWIIAAPIVLFGAPIGAIFCRKTSPKFLTIFIISIVVIEVASTIAVVDINNAKLTYYFCGFGIVLIFILLLSFLSPYKLKKIHASKSTKKIA